MTEYEFQKFPKMARLSRDVVVTEKIDGTNAQIFISENCDMRAGSRTRWLTRQNDNFGFCAWVEDNQSDLLSLGAGRHFGEWWGQGIQRKYDQNRKRFSLFNTALWTDERPECCDVVPVLYQGMFETPLIEAVISDLRHIGSAAAPGFMKPEGVVVFHVAGNFGLKKTLEKDEVPKFLQ